MIRFKLVMMVSQAILDTQTQERMDEAVSAGFIRVDDLIDRSELEDKLLQVVWQSMEEMRDEGEIEDEDEFYTEEEISEGLVDAILAVRFKVADLSSSEASADDSSDDSSDGFEDGDFV